MHLPLAFINCGNILITLCCSLRERQRESSRKQLFFASLQQSTWDEKVCKINSMAHTQELQPFKMFLIEERVFCGCVRRSTQSNLTGLPGPSSETKLQQNRKRNRLWEGRKVARDTGWMTGNTSVNTLKLKWAWKQLVAALSLPVES